MVYLEQNIWACAQSKAFTFLHVKLEATEGITWGTVIPFFFFFLSQRTLKKKKKKTLQVTPPESLKSCEVCSLTCSTRAALSMGQNVFTPRCQMACSRLEFRCSRGWFVTRTPLSSFNGILRWIRCGMWNIELITAVLQHLQRGFDSTAFCVHMCHLESNWIPFLNLQGHILRFF